jgi:hypothetical protein
VEIEQLRGAVSHPPSPSANSLLVIAWHALGNAEENILGLLGAAPVDRQRTAEFDDSRITAQAIRDRWAQLEPDLTATITGLPAEALMREVDHPLQCSGHAGRHV